MGKKGEREICERAEEIGEQRKYTSPLSFKERGKRNATVGALLKLVIVAAAVRVTARGISCRRCHGWSPPSSCAPLVELYLARVAFHHNPAPLSLTCHSSK
ncbi:hypothetical protein S245_055770 [Arachis hypogaea]